ncbi:hypothetical protein QLX08_001414 [Tetragonisca angustula]|uniref:Uncharacterized protein n=1 Tax=Tetragonisca angustula TaxID=166442 RepID=A0AAW1AEZ2_9HYME
MAKSGAAGGYSAEQPDQGGGGSSDWLLISRASLTPRFAAECPTASGHPKGLLVPATKTIPYVYSHYWGPPILHLSSG